MSLFFKNADVTLMDRCAHPQVLEADSGPAGTLRRLQRLSILLLLQRKAWDETFHSDAAWLLCSQRHMAHCCQGQRNINFTLYCYEQGGLIDLKTCCSHIYGKQNLEFSIDIFYSAKGLLLWYGLILFTFYLLLNCSIQIM